MTGYQSKKGMARDKLAHMTFEQRCRVSEQCLPEAPYRAMLVALHDEMLEALAQPAQEPVAMLFGSLPVFETAPPSDVINKKPTKIFGPNLEEILNSAGFYKRTWVDLTDAEIDAEANSILTSDPVQWWRRLARAVLAKSKEKNNG